MHAKTFGTSNPKLTAPLFRFTAALFSHVCITVAFLFFFFFGYIGKKEKLHSLKATPHVCLQLRNDVVGFDTILYVLNIRPQCSWKTFKKMNNRWVWAKFCTTFVQCIFKKMPRFIIMLFPPKKANVHYGYLFPRSLSLLHFPTRTSGLWFSFWNWISSLTLFV